MEPKIRVQFIGKKSRTTKQDLLPIYLRATIQGKRFEVATHQHIPRLKYFLCVSRESLKKWVHNTFFLTVRMKFFRY